MRRLYEELMAMPVILRLTILASFGTGAALLVTTLFKIGTFQIYDETLTGDQLWSEGYGPFFVIAGLILMSAGLGTFKGRGWARWLVVFLSFAMSPIPLIYSRHHSMQAAHLVWAFVVPGFVWAAFFYWYLFHKQKEHFA